MDVLLINPKNIKSHFHELMPPLGLASIGCALEKRGFSVKILDLEIRPDDFDLRAFISNLSPKVLGISGTSHSRFESFRIAKTAKQVSSRIITVYGGCHATFTAEDTLSHIKEIDYVVHGEGEITFTELVDFLISRRGNIKNIKGISFRDSEKIVRTAPRERIVDLDSVSYSRHLLEMDKYDTKLDFLNISATSVITSRGCPYNCYFCSASAMYDNICTMRSAKNVVDEIQHCIDKFNIKGIKFFDSVLTLNRRHILSIIKELWERNINLPWECEITADTVDFSLLESMKKSGCYYVDFAVESASEKMLETIDKKISIKQVTDVLKMCKELEIETKVFFSFGHIGETWPDATETLDFIDRYANYISRFAVSPVVKIYPGTFLEKYAMENGLLSNNFSWSEPFKNIEEDHIFTDNVPIVLQPLFGVKEFKKVYYLVSWIHLKSIFQKDVRKNISRELKKIKSLAFILRKISIIFRAIATRFESVVSERVLKNN